MIVHTPDTKFNAVYNPDPILFLECQKSMAASDSFSLTVKVSLVADSLMSQGTCGEADDLLLTSP